MNEPVYLNTADEIREAALEGLEAIIAETCRERRADGESFAVIEAWAVAVRRAAAEKIERELPRLMRDQAIQLGAASMH